MKRLLISLCTFTSVFGLKDASLCVKAIDCVNQNNQQCNRINNNCPPCIYVNVQGGYLCWEKVASECPFMNKSELTMFDCSTTTSVPRTTTIGNPTTPTLTHRSLNTTTRPLNTTTIPLSTSLNTTLVPTNVISPPPTIATAEKADESKEKRDNSLIIIAIGMAVMLVLIMCLCAYCFRRSLPKKSTHTAIDEPSIPPKDMFDNGIAVTSSQLRSINSDISHDDDLSLTSFPTPSSLGGVDSLFAAPSFNTREDIQAHSTIHEYIDAISPTFAQFYPKESTSSEELADSDFDYRSTDSLVNEGRYSNFSIMSDDTTSENTKAFLRVTWDKDDDDPDKEVEI
ncbi:hypothetical protein THRCLA_02268 [Thraustotheca clavata]|uniref:Secreted protein n=1 Tax=Thraustotheca clavata TaxID=74557 RepID=A0A1W0A5S2_9STRA|nr:hypothetical protein THRCLA_02268 [Thraustotheca clavata]